MGVMYENAFEATPELISRSIADRQHLSRMEYEDWLRRQVTAYQERKKRYWQPDFSSETAYLESVEPNRERWRQALGVFQPEDDDLQACEYPCLEDEQVKAVWVEVRLTDGIWARAIVGRPKHAQGPVPLVVAQHGISSSPEHCFGVVADDTVYWGFGQRLVREGYAVVAPLLTTDGKYRSRLDRLCRLLGFTLEGLEVAKISRLLDWAAKQDFVDPERMAMWGLSMGGFYTLITVPVEPRLKLGIIAAFFNHRVNKLAVEDPRYSCYLPLTEEYIFIPGWLREFSDAELLALFCPRPVQVQCGKCDAVSWWPM
ncbi:MAG: prolyl oligopeptidase family serine peptidase, partial [Armatimonadetes bacterium]|nr:prolyl oligopeptidase family serine peptidase [Armatimonadota bacterium]